MVEKPRILAFAGSTRKESLNKKLVRIAARGAEQAGGDVTVIDLADYPMPLFDEDLETEKGMPEAASRLKKLFFEHQGLLLACPEYNSSITGVLKNAIDWLSRREEGEEGLAAFKGKVAALMSASPGGLGGLRGLVHVRAILGNISVLVIPEQLAIPKAHEAFDDKGELADPKQREGVETLGQKVVSLLSRLA